jgi:hypothetical protein
MAFRAPEEVPESEGLLTMHQATGVGVMLNERSDTLAKFAWTVVVLLWPVAMLNYLDRQMLAAMKSSMMGDIPDIATPRELGNCPRFVQVDLRVSEPLRRLYLGPVQS